MVKTVLFYKVRALKKDLLFFSILLTSSFIFADTSPISFNFENIKLKKAINALVKDHGFLIAYSDQIINPLIKKKCTSCSESEALDLILLGSNLEWKKLGSQYIIYQIKKPSTFSISGSIIDIKTRETIAFANIYDLNQRFGEISDQNGEFSISNISTSTCTLKIKYIGYQASYLHLSSDQDSEKHFQIELIPKVLQSKTISITAQNKEFLDISGTPGQILFSPKHIASLPNLGEVDIFRSLELLPGIQLSKGGPSGLFIRGGNYDQNLVSIDGMTVFQTNHLFGFLSSIPHDIIKNIQLYKSNIPAEFGGRLSSVLNLTTRNGDGSKPRASFSSNFLSNTLTLETPLFSRVNFLINFRKSFAGKPPTNLYQSIKKYVTGDDQFNLISESAITASSKKSYYEIQSDYEDIVSKTSILLSPKHRLSHTLILGRDKILEDREFYGFENIFSSDSIRFDEKTNWSNQGNILNWSSRWNNLFSSRASISQYNYFSDYNSIQEKLFDDQELDIGHFTENNFLENKTIKIKQIYKGFKNHKISLNIQDSHYKILFKNKTVDGQLKSEQQLKQNGFISSFALEDLWFLNNYVRIQFGNRISYFSNTEKFYHSPRMVMYLKANKKITVEFSYNKIHQFIHQKNNVRNTRGTQNMWVLSSTSIPKMTSENSSLGLYYDNNNFSISTSAYKKLYKNIFKLNGSLFEGVSINSDNQIDSLDIEVGLGNSTGFEFLARKKAGQITGWVSYHYNKTLYNFKTLNNSNEFLADYDRSHELKTVTMTRIFHWDISAMWVLSSGAVFTSEEDVYTQSGFQTVINGNKNINRLKPIHRLDVSISKSFQIKYSNIEMGLSIYNVYNKKNISHVRFNQFSESEKNTNVLMFNFTPTLFIKAKI